jgi:comEA protein
MKLKFKNILNTIQTYTNATKSEIYFVAIVLLGLSIGAIYRFTTNSSSDSNLKEAYRIADSLYSEKSRIEKDTLLHSDTSEVSANQERHYVLKINKDLPFQIININKATKIDLMKIPGIGEKTAEDIIEYRKSKTFKSIEEIKEIKGIGIKKFEKMKEFISVK